MKRKIISVASAIIFALALGLVSVANNAPDTPDYRGYTPNDPNDPCADTQNVECGIRIPGPTIPAD
jgi:hypothetical protein